jgi:protein-S-isoprenylcysteine O-methyltransferase Ste14
MPDAHPMIGTIFLSHHPWVLVVVLAIAAGYVLYTNRRG